MNRSFLQCLEDAFSQAVELSDPSERTAYFSELAAVDPALADEVKMMLTIRDDADRLFASGRDHFSLLLTSLGDSKRAESAEELLEFLASVNSSGAQGEMSLTRGFTLQDLVAVGATGFVFRGLDKQLERTVAIKILAPSIARDLKRRRIFINEARLAGSLRHPNVVTIYHVADDTENETVFYVMEWIHGVLLQDLVTSSPPDCLLSVKLLQQLADGVDAIHQRGVIHRDLKPGNIIVQPSGDLTVIDFGLALDAENEEFEYSLAGTPLYMSPEQLQGKELTSRSDLFSLAEIACLLLTGQHPYPADSITELSAMVLQGKPRIPESVDPALKSLLLKGLALEPRHRFETARAFVDACLLAIKWVPPDAADIQTQGPVRRPSRLRRTGVIAVALTMMLTAVVIMSGLSGLSGKSASELRTSAGEKDSEKQTRSRGGWVDDQHYRNFLGMEFVRIPVVRDRISKWPPDADYPELFTNLGWRNLEVDSLIGSQIVTKRDYLNVMGQLPEGVTPEPGRDDEPVTMISFDDASRFCETMTSIDPDGHHYFVSGVNAWTLATYGWSLIEGRAPAHDIMKAFEKLSRSEEPDESLAHAAPLIRDTLGGYWEWSHDTARKATTLEGAVSYAHLPERSEEPIHEVIGGATCDILLHAHDMHYGMNDYFHSMKNLKVHVEEDGETTYLHPVTADEPSYLRYQYRNLPPIQQARLRVPVSLFTDQATGGVRIRSASRSQPDIERSDWKEVYTVHNRTKFPDEQVFVDLTTYLEGATDVEVEYWVQADSDKTLIYAQIGRTAKGLYAPDVFLFEAVTDGRNESPRQFVRLPRSYRSSRVGFRLQMHLPVE